MLRHSFGEKSSFLPSMPRASSHTCTWTCSVFRCTKHMAIPWGTAASSHGSTSLRMAAVVHAPSNDRTHR